MQALILSRNSTFHTPRKFGASLYISDGWLLHFHRRISSTTHILAHFMNATFPLRPLFFLGRFVPCITLIFTLTRLHSDPSQSRVHLLIHASLTRSNFSLTRMLFLPPSLTVSPQNCLPVSPVRYLGLPYRTRSSLASKYGSCRQPLQSQPTPLNATTPPSIPHSRCLVMRRLAADVWQSPSNRGDGARTGLVQCRQLDISIEAKLFHSAAFTGGPHRAKLAVKWKKKVKAGGTGRGGWEAMKYGKRRALSRLMRSKETPPRFLHVPLGGTSACTHLYRRPAVGALNLVRTWW